MQLAHKMVDFLSHLCDGEARKESKQAGQEFLSHLCGDEDCLLWWRFF